MGYHLWGLEESDLTEQLTHFVFWGKFFYNSWTWFLHAWNVVILAEHASSPQGHKGNGWLLITSLTTNQEHATNMQGLAPVLKDRAQIILNVIRAGELLGQHGDMNTQPTLSCAQADTVTSILNFHLLFAPLHKPVLSPRQDTTKMYQCQDIDVSKWTVLLSDVYEGNWVEVTCIFCVIFRCFLWT